MKIHRCNNVLQSCVSGSIYKYFTLIFHLQTLVIRGTMVQADFEEWFKRGIIDYLLRFIAYWRAAPLSIEVRLKHVQAITRNVPERDKTHTVQLDTKCRHECQHARHCKSSSVMDRRYLLSIIFYESRNCMLRSIVAAINRSCEQFALTSTLTCSSTARRYYN